MTTPEPIPYATPDPRPRTRWVIALLVMGIMLALMGLGFLTMRTLRMQNVQVATIAIAKPAAKPKVSMPAGPVEVTVVQRESKAIDGTGGAIRLHAGDITGGQVLVRVTGASGEALLDTKSMQKDDSAEFSVDGAKYQVVVKELKNFLTGEDIAVFVVKPAVGAALTEQEKIERLIQYVAKLEGATFIRNGDEHTPAEAAEHMRTKLEMAGEDVKTAKQFIEGAASKSSISGKPYKVRMKDGKEMEAGELLKEELKRLETGSAATAK